MSRMHPLNRGLGLEDGFTLIEIVCVLAIVALLAGLALPSFSHGTSRARLEAYAIETAALLQADRLAAIAFRRQVSTELDADQRAVRSGVGGRSVRYPDDVHFDAVLASQCAHRAAGSTIDFFPSGLSCGGTIGLTRPGNGFQIRVNWLTGGIEIVPTNTP